jgi:hypothetical protein
MGQCPDAHENNQEARVGIEVKDLARFRTMEEARWWSIRNKKRIKEEECPMVNLPHPTTDDLQKCGMVCDNRWGCHTFRHIFGSREATTYVAEEGSNNQIAEQQKVN